MISADYAVLNLVLKEGVYDVTPGALFFQPFGDSLEVMELYGSGADEVPQGKLILGILYQIILPNKVMTYAHNFSDRVFVEHDEITATTKMYCPDGNLFGFYDAGEVLEDNRLKGKVTQFEA
jgi:hypothetical protein